MLTGNMCGMMVYEDDLILGAGVGRQTRRML